MIPTNHRSGRGHCFLTGSAALLAGTLLALVLVCDELCVHIPNCRNDDVDVNGLNVLIFVGVKG